MDTKTCRTPVVTYEIRVQLSVYRVLLQRDPPPRLERVPVTDWGVVRFKGRRGGPEYRRLRLLSEAEVVDEHRVRRRAQESVR